MDGTALVLCEGAFGTPAGKTAHGLVRFTERYEILGVLDSVCDGRDAGEILNGSPNGIPVFSSLAVAVEKLGATPKYFVIGLAPPEGILPPAFRAVIREAIKLGMNVDSGLHQLLSEDAELPGLAQLYGVAIRDVRRPQHPKNLHTFTGKISEVQCVKIAVLGTDALVGKRTTAVNLRRALRSYALKVHLIGTGKTAWLQGVKYCVITDAILNHYLTGEIEHTIHQAYLAEKPDVILLEGQGSLTDPLKPGGLELLSAGQPDAIILQHAPKRRFHSSNLRFPMIPLGDEIKILELLTRKPVIALTLNHENMTDEEIADSMAEYEAKFKIPATDVLKDGTEKLVQAVFERFPQLSDKANRMTGEIVFDSYLKQQEAMKHGGPKITIKIDRPVD